MVEEAVVLSRRNLAWAEEEVEVDQALRSIVLTGTTQLRQENHGGFAVLKSCGRLFV